MTAKYIVYNGDLMESANGVLLPVHAYIPMRQTGAQMETLEDPPVAYRNQMRAKRIADKCRKQDKRRKPNLKRRYVVIGVTVK